MDSRAAPRGKSPVRCGLQQREGYVQWVATVRKKSVVRRIKRIKEESKRPCKLKREGKEEWTTQK